MTQDDFIDTLQELLKKVDYETIRDTLGLTFPQIVVAIISVAYDAYKNGKATQDVFESEVDSESRSIVLRTILTSNKVYSPLPF